MYLQIGLQTALPAVLIFMQWRSRPANKLKWVLDSLVSFLVLLLLFMGARWDMTSYYLRVLLFPLFGLASFVAYRRIVAAESTQFRLRLLLENGVNLVLILVLGWMNIILLNGRFYPGEAVNLAYPLRSGVFYVGGGGSSRWINNHHAFPPQDYALDIVGLNAAGRPFLTDSTNLEGYAIFGEPIYSPCDGTVLAVENGRSDLTPPHTDSANPAGNYVLIACHDVEILLAHMQQESIQVNPGQTVAEGELLGAVGNSGNSSQPHLHIHAEQSAVSGKILDGQGVPITFDNHFLVRNSLFTGRGE